METITRKYIDAQKAPRPGGPYSQAVIVDKTMYLSGQVGLDPATGSLVPGGVEPEAEQVLKNLRSVLQGAGLDTGNVVKTTVLLADINDWPKVNVIYAKYFPTKPPARAAYQAGALPIGARVEIEAIAIVANLVDE